MDIKTITMYLRIICITHYIFAYLKTAMDYCDFPLYMLRNWRACLHMR